MFDLTGKKLLVLGGITSSCEIIKQAKSMGVYVIVTDYFENSPGKKIADKSFMVSTTDVDAVVELIRNERVDGIITGFVDSILPYYQQICEKAELYCYATKEQIKITINKFKFKQLCDKHNILVVDEYKIDKSFTQEDLKDIEFPVLIKPADNSGGRGISICENINDFLTSYEKALSFSPSKQVIVERYMTGEEVTIFYVIQNGEIYLTAMADRYTKHKQNGIIPLPMAYIFPSKYLKDYQKSLNEKVKEMFKSIGIKNGMIFIQSFVENGKCVFYEMGYRLTGTFEYKIINKINGINPMEMMVNYALTGKMNDTDLKNDVNPNLIKWGCNTTFLAKPGKIGKIIGVNNVSSLRNVIDVVASYKEGDEIPLSALGTLKQVVIRVFAVAETKEQLAETINNIYNAIKVYSDDDENMLLEPFDTKELFY